MTERMLKVKDVVAILGIGESTWWAGVAAKKFPPGIKLSTRTTRWRLSDVERVMNGKWQPGK